MSVTHNLVVTLRTQSTIKAQKEVNLFKSKSYCNVLIDKPSYGKKHQLVFLNYLQKTVD